MKLKVAVTGVGGAVGQSILKALSLSNFDIETWGIDCTEKSAGKYRVDHFLHMPNLKDCIDLPGHWLAYLKRFDAIIPGSDHDIFPLSMVKQDIDAPQILVSCPELVSDSISKIRTSLRFAREGLPFPKTIWKPIIKEESGYGSRGFKNLGKNYVAQEYLEGDEYTCSVFCDKTGEPVATFMAKRELRNGDTYYAEIGYWEEIDVLLKDIGRKLKPLGPLNVQLKWTKDGPIPFELNCRCSGTTGIRAYFGFNEPEMLIRHYILGEDIKQPKITHGKVFRYWNEIFVKEGQEKGEVLAWP